MEHENNPLTSGHTQATPAAGDAPLPLRDRGGPRASANGGAPSSAAAKTAVLFATAAADDGGPAAALRWEDGTVLRRLLEQLADLGVRRVHLVTRPAWQQRLQSSIDGVNLSVRLHPSSTAADDLGTVAQLVAASAGGVVLANADIVTHREALAGLLADPRIVTGILASGGAIGQPFVFSTRTMRGRTVSAASPYHGVGQPNAGFLGVLKIAAADAGALAEVAERLSSHIRGPLPAGWADELARKPTKWRTWLHAAEREREITGRRELARVRRAAAAGHYDDAAVLSAEEEAEIARRAAVAPDDVVSLLLVGLVRSGTHVASSYLRRLFWARPLSRDGVQEAAARIVEHDEDRVLLDSAVKVNDGFFTSFFVSPYSKYLARWAARRGWTPNAVTTLSLVIGVLAAAAFATGDRIGLVAGAVLLQLAFTADCVDGQLSRYTRTFSKFGAWLDSTFDRTKEYIVFAGLAIGASRGFGDDVWMLAAAALTLQTVRHNIVFAFGTARREAIGNVRQPPLEQPRDAAGLALDMAAAEVLAPPPDVSSAGPVVASRRWSAGGLSERGLAAWRVVDRWPGVRWAKRVIAFPIGERFAVISITAAVWTPRVTFIVLLTWGGVALCYSLPGLVARSLSR